MGSVPERDIRGQRRDDAGEVARIRRDALVHLNGHDILVSNGQDLRKLPLSRRKANLARLMARRVDRIHLAPFEQGEIGPDLLQPDGAGGVGFEAPREQLSWRPGAEMDQGQEPAASCLWPSPRSVQLSREGTISIIRRRAATTLPCHRQGGRTDYADFDF